jgi:hypothetical protein
MKLQAHQVTWTQDAWANARVLADKRPLITDTASTLIVRSKSVGVQRETASTLSAPLRAVRILAFCQAIVFIVLFLFICAWTHAGTTAGKPTLDLQVIGSSYAPQQQRNPFGSGTVVESTNGPGAKASQTVAPGMLKLKGILYDPVRPSAVVNGQLVELNKTVTVSTEQGDIEVKALEITREFVMLEVGGRKVELRLSGPEPGKETK